ncbi:hypothetical protein REPUB_Repub11eG0003900 [Reevesia pubescens]
MDVSFPMQHAKPLKLVSDQNFGEGMSRICSLPDSILHYILSLLPIKEAVKTSVLSKRWEFLWTSIAKLEFKEDLRQSVEKRAEFMNFVEKALLLHDSSSIHTFSLTCEVPTDGPTPRINSWIYAALRHKVQKMILDLHFSHYHGSFMLPRHLFACESLKELELDFFNDLRLPSFVYFPNLKILNLSRVFFMDDNSVRKLFSSCPQLEKLDLIECEWDNVKAVHVSAPKLEYLEISEFKADEDAKSDCQFMISGPRLRFFRYKGELINEYCISDAPSLLDAHVDMYLGKNHGRWRQSSYRAHKLLRGLANVKDLHLSSRTFRVLDLAEEQVACLPLFHNLNHLEVNSGTLNFACRVMPKILHNSPHLESIFFAKTVIEVNIVLSLVHLLQPAEFDIKKEAAWAISNATSGGSHEQIRFLVSHGCIKPLCDLLICPDPRIVMVCLEGLENILKVGEADMEMGMNGGINLYAQMIDECDGFDKIENLQTHDNYEIYEKALKILERYWADEELERYWAEEEENEQNLPDGGNENQQGCNFGS